jgi:hypothetical protein
MELVNTYILVLSCCRSCRQSTLLSVGACILSPFVTLIFTITALFFIVVLNISLDSQKTKTVVHTNHATKRTNKTVCSVPGSVMGECDKHLRRWVTEYDD